MDINMGRFTQTDLMKELTSGHPSGKHLYKKLDISFLHSIVKPSLKFCGHYRENSVDIPLGQYRAELGGEPP
jgi:hypothetical protein